MTVTYTDDWREKGNKRQHTITIFREEVTSALADFHDIGFVKEWETRENSSKQGENQQQQQQTKPIHGAKPIESKQAALLGGRISSPQRHLVIPVYISTSCFG